MSRHKLVKQIDLNEELDDYDGGAAYDDDAYNEGDLTPSSSKLSLASLTLTAKNLVPRIKAAQLEQLRAGTLQVRAVLGPDLEVTDQKIQESLWHYYYDVEKSVNFLLNQQTSSNAKAKKKVDRASVAANGSDVSSGSPIQLGSCSGSNVTAEFFKDAPWCNIPQNRRGEILIEPLYPPGRLLGGSPGSGKVSKLAALAAARRTRENARPESGSVTSSVTLLDKLDRKIPKESLDEPKGSAKASILISQSPTNATNQKDSRRYPMRERKNLDTITPECIAVDVESMDPARKSRQELEPQSMPVAPPSAFAQTVFGNCRHRTQTSSQDNSAAVSLWSSYQFPFQIAIAKVNAFAGPSPDDVVLKAQNSKGTKGAKANPEKEINGVTNAISNVAISEAPKVRNKSLDVAAEFRKKRAKPAANFIVIGHVDAGKSTLMGRLLYDLKVVDQRTIDRYRRDAESIGKSSFALAWVLDQGSDERSQGVTIDIGTNTFETDKTAFTILDAPGHRDFIPNMIAGASQADFAVLVIDASTGSFESGLKGQTKEHAILVRSMGVQRIIIAVNKLDTLFWSRDRFEEIQQQVSAFLAAAGFQPKNLAFLPCSGLTGENIIRPATDANASWYTGPSLITLLESSEPFTRTVDKPLRLTIDDIFRGGVQNPVSISGRIDAGGVQIGDVVVTVPSNETASIRGIEVDSESNDWAAAGQNVVLHLADIDQKYLKTGDIICPLSAPIKPLRTFMMKILAFEHLLPMAVEVHRGRLHASGRISQLIAVLDKTSGKPKEGGKKKVKIVKPGSVARVMVDVDDPVPLEVGGKVVLRAGGQTVGAGLLE